MPLGERGDLNEGHLWKLGNPNVLTELTGLPMERNQKDERGSNEVPQNSIAEKKLKPSNFFAYRFN